MIAYTHLVQLVSRLEGKYLGNGTRSTHGVPRQAARFIVDRDNVQYFAVDSSQACPAGTLTNNLAARVVVALGANYSQGSGRLPDSSPSGLISVWAYVEDADLSKMRRFLDEYFDCYEREALREVWTTEEGHELPLFAKKRQEVPEVITDETDRRSSPSEETKDAEAQTASKKAVPRRSYHLVAANFTPWITTNSWSVIRDGHISQTTVILDYPPHGVRTFVELDDLKKLLPPDTIWIAHGNWDVHALFMGLASRWKLTQWFFRGNLAFPFRC